MPSLTTLSTLLAAAVSVAAIPRPLYSRQFSNSSALTGATQGGVETRLEIHALMNDADQWNLYLQALARFKAMDPSDSMSYYQIAGIHGQPYVSYDSVDQCDGCVDTGYCTHSSSLFPTWHRSYLALFEQSLLNNAYEVASEFSGDARDLYTQKAQVLRLPYWDWAAKPATFGEAPWPAWLETDTVNVVTPSGNQSIPNPLKSYSYPADMAPESASDKEQTQRSPSLMTLQTRQNLRSELWSVLSSVQPYNSFATEFTGSFQASGDRITTNSGDPSVPWSLEGVHNNVHGAVGGDMANPDVAAFDPVFWLHHANVDHILSLWQSANPDAWLVPMMQGQNTFTYINGTTEDSSSPLAPFHSNGTDGGFWTSDALRDPHALNYDDSDVASGQTIPSIINALYRDDQPALPDKRSSANATISSTNTSTTVMEYISITEVDSMSMNGSFIVWIFDGPIDDSNPAGWPTSEDLAATNSFFTGRSMGDGTAKVLAGVPITEALLKKVDEGKLANMTTDATVPFIQQNIRIRITSAATGEVIDTSDVPGLQVSTAAVEVTLPANPKKELPSFGDLSHAKA